jgi:hypothetical protein
MEEIKREAIRLLDEVYITVMDLIVKKDLHLDHSLTIKMEEDILDEVQEVLTSIDQIQNKIENIQHDK